MNKQLLINQLINEDQVRCKQLYDELTYLLSSLPKGSLLDRNGHYYHAYTDSDGKRIQQVINNEKFISDLRLRQILKKGMPLLEQRIAANEHYLKNSVIYDPVKIISEMKRVYQGKTNFNVFLKDDFDPVQWAKESYSRNTREFVTEHYTDDGIPVRSKAEAMIGTQLEHRRLSFQCEPRMHFGHKVKCPDFAILLPKTRKIVYLEHFGGMDDPGYVIDTMEKLILYRRHGLHLGVNFFFTWETKARPLNLKQINSTIDEIMALDKVAA